MGVQPIDTIGIVNFVIYIPITLLACFAILRIDVFLEKLKEIVSYADKYKTYYIILLITILLIFVSLGFYISGFNDLRYSYQFGERLQEECKNIYSIYNTANYQLKLNIDDPNSLSSIRKMKIACLCLYIVITLVFISIFLDNWVISNNIESSIIKYSIRGYPVIGAVVLIGVIFSLLKSLNIPKYIKTDTAPWGLMFTYGFILICYSVQYYNMSSKMQPYSIILLGTSLLSIALIYFTQTNNIIDSIETDYFNLTDAAGKNPNATADSSANSKGSTGSNVELVTNASASIIALDVEKIAIQDAIDNHVTSFPKIIKIYSDLPYPINTPFTKYLMDNIKAIPQWNKTVPPDNEPLWPYVLNEVNGMELEEFYITGSEEQKKNILQFRKDMAILRSFNEPGLRLESFTLIINFIIFGIMITILYPIFNMMYINDSLFVTYIVTIGLILVLGICCIIGFISKILP